MTDVLLGKTIYYEDMQTNNPPWFWQYECRSRRPALYLRWLRSWKNSDFLLKLILSVMNTNKSTLILAMWMTFSTASFVSEMAEKLALSMLKMSVTPAAVSFCFRSTVRSMLQKQREEQVRWEVLPTLGRLFRPEGGKIRKWGKKYGSSVILIF